MSDKNRGLYAKFVVGRVDGTDVKGGKHDGCEYFVLDLTHDPFAVLAVQTYAMACSEEYPKLAEDLEKWLGTKMVECLACSKAGGADRAVKHLPPICREGA